MKVLSEADTALVSGAGPLGEIDEAYQYIKKSVKEFWRGLKDGAGLEEK